MQYATPGLPSRKRHLLCVSYSTTPCSDFQIMLLLVNVFKLWSCWLFFNYQCVVCLSCELSTPKLGSHTSPQRQAVTALEPLTTVQALLSSTFFIEAARWARSGFKHVELEQLLSCSDFTSSVCTDRWVLEGVCDCARSWKTKTRSVTRLGREPFTVCLTGATGLKYLLIVFSIIQSHQSPEMVAETELLLKFRYSHLKCLEDWLRAAINELLRWSLTERACKDIFYLVFLTLFFCVASSGWD